MNKLQLDWCQPQPIGNSVVVQPKKWSYRLQIDVQKMQFIPLHSAFVSRCITILIYFILPLIEVNFIFFSYTCWRHKCFCYTTMHAVLFVILRIYFYPIDNLRLCLLPNGYVALLLLIGMELIYFWMSERATVYLGSKIDDKQTPNEFVEATQTTYYF